MQEMQAAVERGDTIYVTDGETVSVSSPTQDEDPVLMLGKRMVDVSRSLWRRVARKPDVVSPVNGAQTQDNGTAVEAKTVLLRQSTEDPHPDTLEKEEDGRVWEEEIDQDFYRRLSIISPGESEEAVDGEIHSDSKISNETSQVLALGKKDVPQQKERRRAATS